MAAVVATARGVEADRRGGDRAQLGERAELAGGARLHEHVAERGRLDRPGEHHAAA